MAIGIIGATVMPHNLYLHSALVQSRKLQKDENTIRTAIRFNTIDSAVALTLASSSTPPFWCWPRWCSTAKPASSATGGQSRPDQR